MGRSTTPKLLLQLSLLAALTLTLTLPLAAAAAAEEGSREEEKGGKKEFIATEEFQEVEEGQAIPPGLHVRLNMQSGKREARLIDPLNPSPSSTFQLAVPAESLEGSEGERAKEEGEGEGKEAKEAKEAKEGSYPRMTKERMKELEEIMEVLMEAANEEPKQLAKGIETVKDPSSSREKVMEALSEMEDIVHLLDYGKDFVELGGFPPLMDLLQSQQDGPLKEKAARVLGAALQNNPAVQRYAHEDLQLMFLLLDLIAVEQDPSVLRSLLFSLSCFLRGNEAAVKEFFDEGHYQGLDMYFEIVTDSKFRQKTISLYVDLLREMKERGEPLNKSYFPSDVWCNRVLNLITTNDPSVIQKGLEGSFFLLFPIPFFKDNSNTIPIAMEFLSECKDSPSFAVASKISESFLKKLGENQEHAKEVLASLKAFKEDPSRE